MSHARDAAQRVPLRPVMALAGGSMLARLARAAGVGRRSGPLHSLTTVHPCFVDGCRTLVYRRGLARTAPEVVRRVMAFAEANGFVLLEDRRASALTCRDERRRLAPLLGFAAMLLDEFVLTPEGSLRLPGGTSVFPTIEVAGRAGSDGGAGASTSPGPLPRYAGVDALLALGAEVRKGGHKRRCRVRGPHLADEYASGFIARYDHTWPGAHGYQRASYFEGEGFVALGVPQAADAIVVDVLAGGGPFAAPRRRGPFDQVLNANVRMEFMFGPGLDDGMGVLSASYRIGLAPVLGTPAKNYYGQLYARALALAVSGGTVPHPGSVQPCRRA